MAPELRAGAAADERSDIYALGMTLHFLLTGRTTSEVSAMAAGMPSAGDSAAREGDAPPVADPALNDILQRCLAPHPEDRIQSVDALYRALAVVVGGGVVPDRVRATSPVLGTGLDGQRE
jgi:serine/threonine protein kinase